MWVDGVCASLILRPAGQQEIRLGGTQKSPWITLFYLKMLKSVSFESFCNRRWFLLHLLVQWFNEVFQRNTTQTHTGNFICLLRVLPAFYFDGLFFLSFVLFICLGQPSRSGISGDCGWWVGRIAPPAIRNPKLIPHMPNVSNQNQNKWQINKCRKWAFLVGLVGLRLFRWWSKWSQAHPSVQVSFVCLFTFFITRFVSFIFRTLMRSNRCWPGRCEKRNSHRTRNCLLRLMSTVHIRVVCSVGHAWVSISTQYESENFKPQHNRMSRKKYMCISSIYYNKENKLPHNAVMRGEKVFNYIHISKHVRNVLETGDDKKKTNERTTTAEQQFPFFISCVSAEFRANE